MYIKSPKRARIFRICRIRDSVSSEGFSFTMTVFPSPFPTQPRFRRRRFFFCGSKTSLQSRAAVVGRSYRVESVRPGRFWGDDADAVTSDTDMMSKRTSLPLRHFRRLVSRAQPPATLRDAAYTTWTHHVPTRMVLADAKGNPMEIGPPFHEIVDRLDCLLASVCQADRGEGEKNRTGFLFL
jgi:hypothetical protein